MAWRAPVDAGQAELFGRLDALYHYATGKRLERSAAALATVLDLLCAYGSSGVEEVFAYWLRHPEYSGGGDDPLEVLTDESVYADLAALAGQDDARARLVARFSPASDPTR